MAQNRETVAARRASNVQRGSTQKRPIANKTTGTSNKNRASVPAQKNKKASSGPDKGLLFLIAVIVALAVVLLVKLTGSSTVKEVSVKYTQQAARAAAERGLTDADFIRQSGVMSRKMSDINQWKQEAADNIATLPGFLLNDVKKISSSGVQLEIGMRTPAAVLSTGSGYITIDRETYIIEKKTTYSDKESILVDGISLRNPTVGQLAVDVSTDGRLENAMYVIGILEDNHLTSYFTNIHMLADNEVRLVSTYDIPVIINMWFKDTFADDLTATVQVLNEKGGKNQSGWIYAVNGNITWHEDADYFSPIKGK